MRQLPALLKGGRKRTSALLYEIHVTPAILKVNILHLEGYVSLLHLPLEK